MMMFRAIKQQVGAIVFIFFSFLVVNQMIGVYGVAWWLEEARLERTCLKANKAARRQRRPAASVQRRVVVVVVSEQSRESRADSRQSAVGSRLLLA